MRRPNVLFVFADQWRAQALSYAGDPNVATPRLVALEEASVNFTHAVAGCPVCSPYRASLMSGQYPLTHGVFVNDVPLRDRPPRLGWVFREAGYDTGYIGKWHLDGHGRSAFTPPGRRLGFDYWKALECTHDYLCSAYYAGDSPEKRYWDGYDAMAQTEDACGYLRGHAGGNPWLLVVSWGPPHNPYETAPAEFRQLYAPEKMALRENVPADMAGPAREWLAGYYAHCTALDRCIGRLLDTLCETGQEEDTLFVFTSDHGDMLGSHGQQRKQRPWDESIRVPFLLRYPGLKGWNPRRVSAPINVPDVMPTLLGLAGIGIPEPVEGYDFSEYIRGGSDPSGGAALLGCPHPFGEWHFGRAYRGLRTERYTYVRGLDGPWLLYDNETDPFQSNNRVNHLETTELQRSLDGLLQSRLNRLGDEFLPGDAYLSYWGYAVDATGTVPYSP